MRIETSSTSPSYSLQRKSQIRKKDQSPSSREKKVSQDREQFIKQQTLFLSTVQKNINKKLQDIKEDFSRKKESMVNKAEDEFYTISRLDPTLTEEEGHYLISLAIPEHESEQVSLSANNRKIRLSASRRFEDKLMPNKEESFYTKRSEMHMKEFPVKDIVTGRNLIKKYENGILTFKVFKA